MQAGLLKEWITFQIEEKQRTPSGSVSRKWVDVTRKRARVQYKSGNAVVATYETTHTATITVTIRYDKKVNRTMRVLWNGEKYRILSADRDRAQMALVLVCELINE